ncbi:MAG: universal stress protein [Chloroflexota bacterium]
MLEHVVVPLDGSLLAQTALDFATQIVGANCEITLLTAIQPPEVPVYGTTPMVVVPNHELQHKFELEKAEIVLG